MDENGGPVSEVPEDGVSETSLDRLLQGGCKEASESAISEDGNDDLWSVSGPTLATSWASPGCSLGVSYYDYDWKNGELLWPEPVLTDQEDSFDRVLQVGRCLSDASSEEDDVDDGKKHFMCPRCWKGACFSR